MPRTEQHTIVRFPLRSLLTVTAGLAVLMTILGPTIRTMEPERFRFLLFSIAACCAITLLTTVILTVQRSNVGRRCGPLLLSLALTKKRTPGWPRWVWLLISFPGMIFMFYVIGLPYTELKSLEYSNYFYLFIIIIAVVSNVIGLSHEGLSTWAEGYSNGIEFCQNGILYSNKFYAWGSSSIRDIHWTESREKLVVNLNRSPLTLPVPLEQCEGVNAILEYYYKPARARS